MQQLKARKAQHSVIIKAGTELYNILIKAGYDLQVGTINTRTNIKNSNRVIISKQKFNRISITLTCNGLQRFNIFSTDDLTIKNLETLLTNHGYGVVIRNI